MLDFFKLVCNGDRCMQKGATGLTLIELVIVTALSTILFLSLSRFIQSIQTANFKANLTVVRSGIINRFYTAINNPRVLFLSAGCPSNAADPCPTAPDALIQGTSSLSSPCPTPINSYQSQLFACIGNTSQCPQAYTCPSASAALPLFDPSFISSQPSSNFGNYYYTLQGSPGSSSNYAFQVSVYFLSQVKNSVSLNFTVTPNPSLTILKGWSTWSSVSVSYSTPILKLSPTNYNVSLMNTANVSAVNGPDLCRNLNGIYNNYESLCELSPQSLPSTCPATGKLIIRNPTTNILYQCNSGVQSLVPVYSPQSINGSCTVIGSFAINSANANQILVCSSSYTWQNTD
jgi:hypothetical protein